MFVRENHVTLFISTAGECLPLIQLREGTQLVMHHHLAVARTRTYTPHRMTGCIVLVLCLGLLHAATLPDLRLTECSKPSRTSPNVPMGRGSIMIRGCKGAQSRLYLVQISGLWVHMNTINIRSTSSYIAAHCSLVTARVTAT